MSYRYDPVTDRVYKMISIQDLYDYFTDKGFFFSREVLTRYYLSLKTKPFVILSGISGTGKTKIAQLFAEYICQEEENADARKRVAFVPVRPDWMDNKGLLGYFNILDEKYHSTPVLDLLLEAQDHPDKPYFIILDEMNLAKVEHYFSDFLSVMESRTPDRPEGEALRLHPHDIAEAPDGRIIPGSVHIPANVFFAGTVNVDESTYMFSPKVLDRANVIEFNEVDLEAYAEKTRDDSMFILTDPEVINRFYNAEAKPFCRKQDFDDLPEDGKIVLREILAIMKEGNLHFGYRVTNEISRLVRLASEEVAGQGLNDALDIQILQKILPKLHGTKAKLEAPLEKLRDYCDSRFPRSARKIQQMEQHLSMQGYASFIE